MSKYIFRLAGDTAIVVDFGNRIDFRLNKNVLFLVQRLNESKIDGVMECVPTIRSLTVHYEPLTISCMALQERLTIILRGLPDFELAGLSRSIQGAKGKFWRLPVCYDPTFALDLTYVAERTGLSATQVVERHSGATYHVYMLGFLPGLAYLGDLPEELALPRRENPRPMIPGGSVGIATQMTCVYPMKTPCGWHIVGRSPVQLWDARRQDGALLAAGDQVNFEPVSVREYERLCAEAQEGRLRIAPLTSP